MVSIQDMIDANKENLKRINIPSNENLPKRKVLIFEKSLAHKDNLIKIKDCPLSVKSHRSIHPLMVGGVITAGYPNVELYTLHSMSKWTPVIDWCIDNDIRIISMSMATSKTNEREQALKKYADWGGIFTAASGNWEDHSVAYPASSQYTVGVSATNSEDSNDDIEVDITVDSYWKAKRYKRESFRGFSGTSGAQPVVPPFALRYQNANPTGDLWSFKKWLISNSIDNIDHLDYSSSFGKLEEGERYFIYPDDLVDTNIIEDSDDVVPKLDLETIDDIIEGVGSMTNKIKYSTLRRFGTDIHVLEYKTNDEIKSSVCGGDREHRQKLTDIKHNWYESEGYEKVGGVNLQFFAYTNDVSTVGLEYVDSGFVESRVDSVGAGFYEAIYMNDTLIIEELRTQKEFEDKYLGKAEWGVSLSYTLVLDGKMDIRGEEHFNHSKYRHPRTLIGQKATGELLMVVAEGRNSNDKGLNAEESAEIMLELGANNAINADGGGSSTMELEGDVVNFLSDGSQRNVANALLIYAKDGNYEIDMERDKTNLEEIDMDIKIIAKYLNVRRFAGLDYPTVDKFSNGDIIRCDGKIDGWYKVKGKEHYFSGKDYFCEVHKDYTKYNVEDNADVKKGEIYRANILNVRSGPSTSYDVVDRIDKGDIVSLYEKKGRWYRISTDTWIYDYYVKTLSDVTERFAVLTTEELIDYCNEFNWTRKPREIHVHHTWRPRHEDFNGSNHKSLQKGMRNYHMNNLGWRDIGQDLSLAPDGKWILGRDFNTSPVSIPGRNYLGFAIEMIGNFDKGGDDFTGDQKEAMYSFMNYLMPMFGISYVFHRDYSYKTCPGNSIDRYEFDRELKLNSIDSSKRNEFLEWFKSEFKCEIEMDDIDDIVYEVDKLKKG